MPTDRDVSSAAKRTGRASLCAALEGPLWCEDFDADLPKVVPYARSAIGVSDPQSKVAGKRSRKPTRAKHLGVTDDEYARMFHKQGDVCAICGNPPKKRRLHVDHDHRTGKVRGLLCFRCNRALPNYVTADWLLRAYAYVNRNGEADVPDQWGLLRAGSSELRNAIRSSPHG